MISPRQSFPVHSTHIVSLKYYDHNNDDADDDEVDADFDNVEAGSPERIDEAYLRGLTVQTPPQISQKCSSTAVDTFWLKS